MKKRFLGEGNPNFLYPGENCVGRGWEIPVLGQGDRPRYTLMIELSMLFSWAAAKKRTKEYYINQITVGIVRCSSLGTGLKREQENSLIGLL